MRKWEKKYEYYKSTEAQKKYEELKEKIAQKKANSEEVKEYNRITKVLNNLPKVDNIKEYMEKLDKNLKILKEEYYLREDNEKSQKDKEKSEKKVKELQEECEKIREEQKKIQKEINGLVADNKDGKNDEQISKLRASKRELEGKYNNTLIKTQDEEAELQKNVKLKAGRKELAGFSKKQLRKECFETAGMINKCNIVAGHLMEGLSRESIELKLNKDWKDRKFTAKDALPLTKKEREERDAKKKAQKEEANKEQSDAKKENIKPEKEIKDEGQEANSLIEQDEFAKAFPRLARILPKFVKNSRLAKAMVDRKNKNTKERSEEQNDLKAQIVKIDLKNNKKKKTETERDRFIKSLKEMDIMDVAEKGIDQINKERLEEVKRKAHKKEIEKFGENYNKGFSDNNKER